MQYNTLGASQLNVSEIMLGSMTWGRQNTYEDACQQIDYAFERGINFIDTAELYAIPPTEDTYGATETIIGQWLLKNPSKRDQLILATKIAGAGLPWIREGAPINRESIASSIDASLKRLKTEYIDLYQLHWPNRPFPHFSNHWPNQRMFSETNAKKEKASMLAIMEGLDDSIKAGKIRHWGLSNETCWGLHAYLNLAKEHHLTPPVSVQNEFSLIQTQDWPHLLEMCIHENIAYLSWSPLGSGVLSGKYLNGKLPEGSRWTITQRNGLFRDTPATHKAVEAYSKLAVSIAITPAQLALAWCQQVDGMTSTIIGATSMSQLKEDIDAFNIKFNATHLEEILSILKQHAAPF